MACLNYVSFLSDRLDSYSDSQCSVKELFNSFNKRANKHTDDIFVVESGNDLLKRHPDIYWGCSNYSFYNSFFIKLEEEIL